MVMWKFCRSLSNNFNSVHLGHGRLVYALLIGVSKTNKWHLNIKLFRASSPHKLSLKFDERILNIEEKTVINGPFIVNNAGVCEMLAVPLHY